MMEKPFSATISAYLTQLESASPFPGGGSTSAVVAALGSAISLMAGRISDRSEVDIALQDKLQILQPSIQRFEDLCFQDMTAFSNVMDSLITKQKEEQLQEAVMTAAEIPIQLAEHVVEVLQHCLELLPKIHLNVLSDIGCAAIFLEAALQGAVLTAKINLQYIKEKNEVNQYIKRMQVLQSRGQDLTQQIIKHVEEKMLKIKLTLQV